MSETTTIPVAEKSVLATAHEKLVVLRDHLRTLGSVVLGFSGGVDSTLLAAIAGEELGEKMLAVTSDAETYAAWEKADALALAQQYGFRHRVVKTSELSIPGYAANTPDRCYFCKGELYTTLRAIAEAEGYAHIVDGVTADDAADYRPGRKAAHEHNAVSPLAAAGFTKPEIRALSNDMNLPTWDKPANACLSSRFPYGEEITAEKLKQVGAAEDYIRALGIRLVRVRHHGTLARIEVSPADMETLLPRGRDELVAAFRSFGYQYVTLDLVGYRSGSLNEVLPAEQLLKHRNPAGS